MEILDKCRKLAALAKQGEPGERDNAKRLLDALMAQHGLTANDIEGQEETVELEFKWKDQAEKDLVVQCLVSLDLEPTQYAKSRQKVIMADTPKSKAASTIAFVKAHIAAYRKEVEMLLMAYLNRHDLFSRAAKERAEQQRIMTEEEIQRAREILRRAEALSDVHIPNDYKKITHGRKD